MMCILLNSVVMAVKHFPEPEDLLYRMTFDIINYLFAAIFFVEAVLKIFSLRSTYFIDNWNLFDCVCVFASLAGIVLDLVFGLSLGTVMSGIRLFRIARLFRLLRFAKGLNKLFNTFLASIPKLMNVALILMLLLFLFSVMSVAMFAKTHFHGPHDFHCNFRSFSSALLSLIRCMTGEGWNEVMHSMMKTAIDFGRMQQPCVEELFVTKENYDVLASKCLVPGGPGNYDDGLIDFSFSSMSPPGFERATLP